MLDDPRLRHAGIVATGGAADLVRRAIPAARIDRDLTFRGLAGIFRAAASTVTRSPRSRTERSAGRR